METRNRHLRLRHVLTTMSLFFILQHGHGQFAIQYPSAAEGMTACLNTGKLSIRIDVASPVTIRDTVFITLPPGITYASGSIQKTGGTGSLGIAEAGGTPPSPRFVITPDTLFAGDFIIFTFERLADCEARVHALNGGIFKDTVLVRGSAGSTIESDPAINPYNILYPSLSFTQPAAVNNTVVGGSYARSFTISNGAVGTSNFIHFYIVYQNASAELVSLTLAGFGSITPHTINGDTLFFSLQDDQLGSDSLFTNGEVLSFTETFRVRKCDAFTLNRAGWGCGAPPAEWCQQTGGSGNVTMASGLPNLVYQTYATIQLTDMCQDWIGRYTYINNGSESVAGAGNAFNISPLYGINSGGLSLNHTSAIGTIVRIEVGGISVSFNTTTPGIGAVVTLDLTSDPDGAGTGLEDLDGDGYYDDLAIGQSFSFDVFIQFVCQSAIPSNHSTGGGKVSMDYENQCGVAQARVVATPPPSASNAPLSPLSITGPADLNDGDTLLMTGCFARRESFNGNFYSCPDDSLLYSIKIPAGFSYVTGSARFRNLAAPVYFSGDTLFIVGQANGVNLNVGVSCFEARFELDCSGYIATPFQIGLNYVCNTSCACKESWGTASYSPFVHCGGPCPDGGLTTTGTRVRRLTIGYTDNTGSARVDGSLVPPASLIRALPCDTLLISAWGYQVAGLSGGLPQGWDTGMFSIEYSRLSSNNLLEYIDGTVAYYNALTSTTTSCPLPLPTISTSGGIHKAVYNLSSCFAPDSLRPGDSLNVFIKAVVLQNSGLTAVLQALGGAMLRHYNTVSGVEYSCDQYSAELYLHRYQTTSRSGMGNINVNGCAAFNASLNVYSSSTATDLYPGEYRPDFYLDSIVINLGGTNSILNPAVMPVLRTRNEDGSLASTDLGAPSYYSSTGFVWVNPGNWPISDEVTESGSTSVSFSLLPSCNSSNGNIGVNFRGKSNRYAFPPACQPIASVSASGPTTFNLPFIALTDLTGTIQAYQPQHTWDIRISNPSTQQAPYLWLALPDKPGITIDSVVDMATNTALIPVTYGPSNTDLWYPLSAAGLSSGASNDYRIFFRYFTCNPDSIRVLAGWNCASHPSDPNDYPCNAQEIFLKFIPQVSEVEIIPIAAPSDSVDLCEPAEYQYNINCSQAANTVNNVFHIIVPQGMYPTGDTVQAEYPAGAGNWEAITGVLAGSNYSFDLTTHSAYPGGTGLPGTLSGVSNEQRQIGIRFRILTDCDFVAGSSFTLNTTAMRPCGQPAIGNSLIVQSPPVNITGVIAAYLTVNSISAPPGIACSGSVLIQIQTTIIAGSTGTKGKAFVDLAPGMSYVTGSLGCSSSPYCPSFLGTSTLPSGRQRVTLGIPPAVPASTTMDYSLEVHYAMRGQCGINNIQLQTIDDFGNIVCATEPSGFCDTVAVQTGSGSANILIEMPDLSLSSFQVSGAPGGSGGESVSFTITVSNNGLDMAFGQTAYVNIYSDLLANGSYDPGLDAFITVIPVQGLDNGASQVITATAFASGLLNTCRYIAVLDTGNVDYPSPCICTRDEIASTGSPQLRNAGPDQIICAGTFTQIGMTPVQGYVYGWNPTTNLSDPNSGNPAYSSLVPGSYEYILTTTRPGGCASTRDTVLVTVLAAPVATFTSTNVSCFNKGNGSITITASGGTPPYTYSIDNGASYPYSGPSPFTISNLNPGLYQVRVRDANGCETNLCR